MKTRARVRRPKAVPPVVVLDPAVAPPRCVADRRGSGTRNAATKSVFSPSTLQSHLDRRAARIPAGLRPASRAGIGFVVGQRRTRLADERHRPPAPIRGRNAEIYKKM